MTLDKMRYLPITDGHGLEATTLVPRVSNAVQCGVKLGFTSTSLFPLAIPAHLFRPSCSQTMSMFERSYRPSIHGGTFNAIMYQSTGPTGKLADRAISYLPFGLMHIVKGLRDSWRQSPPMPSTTQTTALILQNATRTRGLLLSTRSLIGGQA